MTQAEEMVERYSNKSIKALIHAQREDVHYKKGVLANRADKRAWANGKVVKRFPAALDDMESALLGYAKRWGDSADMRLVMVFVFHQVNLIGEEPFGACMEIISEVCSSDVQPALFLAATLSAKKATREGGFSFRIRNGSRQKSFLTLWSRGLKSACDQLDLEDLSGAPKEVFEGFLDPYMREEFRKLVES